LHSSARRGIGTPRNSTFFQPRFFPKIPFLWDYLDSLLHVESTSMTNYIPAGRTQIFNSKTFALLIAVCIFLTPIFSAPTAGAQIQTAENQ
jgi:hypothetical protein